MGDMPNKIFVEHNDKDPGYLTEFIAHTVGFNGHTEYYHADYVRRLMRCISDLVPFVEVLEKEINRHEFIGKPNALNKHADLISQCRAELEKGE